MKTLADLKAEPGSTTRVEFLNWYARRALVRWAAECLESGTFAVGSLPPDAPRSIGSENLFNLCLDMAREKKWVSSKELKVLSGGYKAATGFCKKGM